MKKVGILMGSDSDLPVVKKAKEAGIITFDANHEMAGKELNFKIELVEIC